MLTGEQAASAGPMPLDVLIRIGSRWRVFNPPPRASGLKTRRHDVTPHATY
jgi:hypothetical protein